MMHGRWPNGWSVVDVSRWLESNFDFANRFSGNARLRFLRRFDDDAQAKASTNTDSDGAPTKSSANSAGGGEAPNYVLPNADKAVPEAKLDKQIAEMLGTLKSSHYLQGNLDNSCGSDPALAALLDAHHGTRFVHEGLSASILEFDLAPEDAKLLGDGEAALVATDLGKLFLLVDGNGEPGFQPGQDFIIPLGSLPPSDLGMPPVI